VIVIPIEIDYYLPIPKMIRLTVLDSRLTSGQAVKYHPQKGDKTKLEQKKRVFGDRARVRTSELLFAICFSLCATIILWEFSFFQFPRKAFLLKGNPRAFITEVQSEFEWDKKGEDGQAVLEVELGGTTNPGKTLHWNINGQAGEIVTTRKKLCVTTFPLSILLQGKNRFRLSSGEKWAFRRLRVKNVSGYSKGFFETVAALKGNRYGDLRSIRNSSFGAGWVALFFLLNLVGLGLPGLGRWAALRRRRWLEPLRWLFLALVAIPLPAYLLTASKIYFKAQIVMLVALAVVIISWVPVLSQRTFHKKVFSLAHLEPEASKVYRSIAAPWSRWLGWPVLFCVVGLLVSYRLSIFGGLTRLPMSIGDGKLNHAFLEHSWLWVSRVPLHTDLWNAPFFYPLEGVMARGDLMASCAPPYWVFRGVGCDPDVSFFGWLVIMCAINFYLVVLLLKRFVGVALLPSSIGAYLFCFAAVRIGNSSHIQLLPHCFVLGSVLCAAAYVENVSRRGNVWAGRGWVLAAVVLLALQSYAAFYLLLFYTLAYGVGILVGASLKSGRRFFLRAARRDFWALILAAVTAVAVVWPAYSHYSRAAEQSGTRPVELAAANGWKIGDLVVPTTRSWLHVQAFHNHLLAFKPSPASITLGWVSSLAVLAGVFLILHRPAPRFLMITFFLTAMLGFTVAGRSLWELVYRTVPGAPAIRTTFRIGLLLHIPAVIGLAMTMNWALTKRWVWRAAAGLVAVWIAVEQVPSPVLTSRSGFNQAVQRIVDAIPPDCEAFYFTKGRMKSQVRVEPAIWAAFVAGVPTVNGRTGMMPEGSENLVLWGSRRARVRGLRQWLNSHGRPSAHVAFIRQ
jgi:hypothetical protein